MAVNVPTFSGRCRSTYANHVSIVSCSSPQRGTIPRKLGDDNVCILIQGCYDERFFRRTGCRRHSRRCLYKAARLASRRHLDVSDHAGRFSVLSGVASFFCGDFFVDDSNPSSPLFILSFNKSLLPILSYFNFKTSCAKAI